MGDPGNDSRGNAELDIVSRASSNWLDVNAKSGELAASGLSEQ